jgi:spoIIIJ-associated protein
MTYEYEGRTEKEAIEKAVEELGMEQDSFDVEILESQKQGLFKKGMVRIRVHFNEEAYAPPSDDVLKDGFVSKVKREAKDTFEQQVIDFVEGVISHMGYRGVVSVQFRESHKLGLRIDSPDSSILIGKKGKNLDALQLITNLYASPQRKNLLVILDSENYRLRREESLVRMAYSVADKVRETRQSILLEPMNPYDRRLIHTTISDIADLETKSEGEGTFKQVRVSFRGQP